ncbi:ABC transporter permease subunit [Oculatella sp. LEGE 06141]|uniref:ABC transporter permease n=1 Tax=Oculatella sp. LEGE 06141 TaxID=1828648 RepID=UPI00187EE67F|nr:ABC transporter permease [Oculatella sp. LEGE 06141]MBE9177416.1 ABC transporter permease subunit [Oculatella sp. LEGE 06141]
MGVIIGNVIAIYRRELQSYFASPFAYLIAGIFWLLGGFFFTAILLGPDGLIAQVAVRDQLGITQPPIDVAYQFLSIFLGVIGSLSLFVLPILSMGLYAEERKRGTLELLATSPVTNWAVALGKLLGVVTFFITLILPIMVYEAIALSASDPPVSPTVMLLGHLGLILLAAAILSLGMFVSSLTDKTILAAFLTFGLILLLWIIDPIAQSIGGSFGDALGHLSLLRHYTNLIQGILDSGSIIVFVSYIVLGLFLTAQSIEALRFQQS